MPGSVSRPRPPRGLLRADAAVAARALAGGRAATREAAMAAFAESLAAGIGRVLINAQIAPATKLPAFCVPKILDAMVRRTDAGCELPYLPQATEEDHDAQPFKGTDWNCCAHLRSGGTMFRRVA